MTAICKTTVGSVNSRKNTGKKKKSTERYEKHQLFFLFFFSVTQRKEANVEKLTQRKNKYNDR